MALRRGLAGLMVALLLAFAARAEEKKADPRELTMDSIVFSQTLAPGEPPMTVTLGELLRIFHAPGLSLAVIDDEKIAWARGYGVTAAGGSEPVTVHTLFQAASISKPVTAMGALKLVEQGKLSLDTNVNETLRGWKVPENELTKTEKVTLRRLMSHAAGLTVHGFAGYPVGAPLPTLPQILDGAKPANSAPIRVDSVPGSKCMYSGGGVVIETLLMTEAAGEPFAQFMDTKILPKLGMAESTYAQPLPAEKTARAAIGTHGDGRAVEGRWHVYPEEGPDGLWTTPTDLAKLAIEVSLSKQGKANHLLSEKTTREMLTTQQPDGDGPFGLGWGTGIPEAPDLIRHNGANDGFQSVLVMQTEKGRGYAAMSNSDSFELFAPFIRRALAESYGFYDNAKPSSDAVLRIALDRQGAAGMLRVYQQLKQADPKQLAPPDKSTLIGLGYALLEEKKMDGALAVFREDVKDFAGDWNAWDSLAEAEALAGQKAKAIEHYEQSIALNPKSESGPAALKKLRAAP